MRSVTLLLMFAAVVVISCSGGEKTNSAPTDVFLVAIDAAHGGDAPGAISETGVAEKDIVLSMTRYIEDNCDLEGVKIELVRNMDEKIGLVDRLERIANMDADVVISLHTDGSKDTSKRGISIYHREDDISSMELCDLLKTNLINIENIETVECGVAAFTMLEDSQVPTISIELGHITNNEDYQFMTSEKGKEALGAAIVATIDEYYSTKKKNQ